MKNDENSIHMSRVREATDNGDLVRRPENENRPATATLR
jgi:hypothetical protein